MDDEQRIALAEAGYDPDAPDIVAMIDLVRWELALKQAEDGREIRSKDLRLIRLEDWLEYIVAACAWDEVRQGRLTMIKAGEPSASAIRAVRSARQGHLRGAPRKIDETMLLKVAEIYRERLDDRPTLAVQRAFGVQPRTASRYVQLARERGLLPETTPGKKKA